MNPVDVTVVVTEIPAGTSAYEAAVENYKRPRPSSLGDVLPSHRYAKPLDYWLRVLGGHTGELTMPHSEGRRYPVSLAQWRNADPHATYLSVGFHWKDPAKLGSYALPPNRD